MDALSDTDLSLMRSLLNGRKYLDMMRSPVKAIERGFVLIDLGLVDMNGGWLTLTAKGREVVMDEKIEQERNNRAGEKT